MSEPFSWRTWLGGFVTGLGGGCIGNVVAFIAAGGPPSPAVWVSVVPGVLVALLAFAIRKQNRSFSIGLFTGGCVVALLGGPLCTWMINTVGILEPDRPLSFSVLLSNKHQECRELS